MEDELVGWGRVVRIETTGRRSGRIIPVVVGYVEREGAAIVVAATSPDASWARNLEHEPRCRVTIGERSWIADARPLEGREHAAAVRDLILRYGTPSEGLGSGPSFELVPAEPSGD
jgi:deazaflavin-dependent oxidoreductase (nitroreductase family)